MQYTLDTHLRMCRHVLPVLNNGISKQGLKTTSSRCRLTFLKSHGVTLHPRQINHEIAQILF